MIEKTIAKATLFLTLITLLPLSIIQTQATVQGAASLFIMGPDAVSKNMELKAIKDSSAGGVVKQVEDFKLGVNNVVSVPLNAVLTISSDMKVEFTGAKLTPAATTDSLDIPIIGDKINLVGVAQGVYTLDVIVGDKAYECIVVIAIAQNPQQVINQITEINTDNTSFTKIFEKGKNKPTQSPTPSPEPSICYFHPNDDPSCVPVDGQCPDDAPNLNEQGNCHPSGCPPNFSQLDDDETGTCYSDKNVIVCEGSNAKVLHRADCAIYEPDTTPSPEPTPEPLQELKEETPTTTPTPEVEEEELTAEPEPKADPKLKQEQEQEEDQTKETKTEKEDKK